MGPTRLVILLVAAVASIGLGILVFNMMGRKAPPTVIAAPAAEVTVQKVLVAKRDLKVGERVTAAALAWQPWPPSAVNESYITDGEARPAPSTVAGATDKVLDAVLPNSPAMAAVEGSVVREAILANEPIQQRKLIRGGEGGYMSVVLQPGMRAVSVPVTVETGVGGFVLPNDHVDLILNQKVEIKTGEDTSDSMSVSKVIMRNLRVLAIDQNTEPEKGARTIVGAVATLEVPTQDLEVVTAAKGQGELVLSLRPYSEAAGGPQRAFSGSSGGDVVRVFRNGVGSEVRVAQ